MHASVALVGAFAVGTFAIPSAKHGHLHHHQKRDVVTVMDYDYKTVQETVVVGPSPAPVPDYGRGSGQKNEHHGGHQPHHGKKQGGAGKQKKVKAADYGGDSGSSGGWGSWPSWGQSGSDHNQGGWSYFWGSKPQHQEQPAPQPQPQPQPEQQEQPVHYEKPQPKPQPQPEQPVAQPKPKPKPQPQPQPQPQQPSGGNSNGGSNTYQKNIVDSHNVHRANHSAPALGWDDSLANAAMMHAVKCNFEHDTEIGSDQCKYPSYGQNIAAGVSKDQVAKVVNDMWYNGEVDLFASYYNQANPPQSSFEGWGHFTQMVWKSTNAVGCATVECTGQGNMESFAQPAIFTVCNYGPPGNMAGAYNQNVKQPENQPTVAGTKCHL